MVVVVRQKWLKKCSWWTRSNNSWWFSYFCFKVLDILLDWSTESLLPPVVIWFYIIYVLHEIFATQFLRQISCDKSVHGEIAWLLSYDKTVGIYKENSSRSIFYAINFRRFHHEHFLSYDKWQYIVDHSRLVRFKLCMIRFNLICQKQINNCGPYFGVK